MNYQYLAGFIDGEGYMGYGGHHNGQRYYYLQLWISGTHKPTLEKISKFLNGDFITRPASDKPNRKQQYYVRATGKKAVEIIKKCFPHFHVKKAEAEYIIKCGYRGIEVDKENLQRLKQYEFKDDKFFQPELEEELQLELGRWQ